MSDLFNSDIPELSDPDPIKRAQASLQPQLPKRFYKNAAVAKVESGYAVQLDGKPVRTPGKAVLALPTEAAAQLVADEFNAQAEHIDPMSMPVLRLANSAIDGVAPNARAVLEDVVKYSSSDLLCYRADGPERLVERQQKIWDPALDWARTQVGARLFLAEGVMHVEQPSEALDAVYAWLLKREEPFRLAAIHTMTSITGSAILALIAEARAMSADDVWEAAHLDERWTSEHWGEDAEAMAREKNRRRDFDAALNLCEALDA